MTAIYLDGQPWRSADHLGKIVVLDFWATWCGPCVDSIPQLKKLYSAHRAHPDFEMFGMSIDVDAPVIRRFVRQQQLPWAQAYQPEGDLKNEIMTLGGHGIPSIAILTKSGALDGVWHSVRDAEFALRSLLPDTTVRLGFPPNRLLKNDRHKELLIPTG